VADQKKGYSDGYNPQYIPLKSATLTVKLTKKLTTLTIPVFHFQQDLKEQFNLEKYIA